MALAQKLEQDNLRLNCERSVEELHHLFVAWFKGTEPRDGLSASLLECLAPNFSHVAPNGQFLQGRSILISHLQDKYGCYKDRLFQIEIFDVKLLWQDGTGERCLCTYEEWQSWLPENSQDQSNGGDDLDDSIDELGSPSTENLREEVHQFGRLSTCLLERKPHAPSSGSSLYRWLHVHETWLEAESPQHEKDLPDTHSQLGDSTILTGPIEYQKMIATRGPSALGGDNRDEDDEQDDDDNDSMGPHASSDVNVINGNSTPPVSSDSVIKPQHKTVNASGTVGAMGAEGDDLQEPTDRHLLMLMSNQSLSREQMNRQNEARNILESSGIAFYEMDGANPEERENRNQLFQLSGKWGKYPQFFLVDTSGSTVFWGDFDRFKHSHAANRLQDDIENHLDETDAEDDTTANEDSSMPRLPPSMAPNSPLPAAEESSASSSSREHDRSVAKQLARASEPVQAVKVARQQQADLDPPALPKPATNCCVLLLMSKQTLSRDQKQRQVDMARIMEEEELKFEQIDGSLKDSREKRNQLFRTSTFWGKYPQLFHENKDDGTITFWGAWEEFQTSVERKSVGRDLSFLSPPPPLSSYENQHSVGTRKAEDISDSDTGGNKSIASIPRSEQKALPTAESALAKSANQDPIIDESDASLHFDKPIILLSSHQSLSREQMNRQEKARQFLHGMDYVELDGSSREHRHARNELFRVSKLWGRYPQLHLKTPGQSEPVFYGDWEKLDTAYSQGTLKRDIMAIVAPEEELESEPESTATPHSNQLILLDTSPASDKVNGAPSWATLSGAQAGAIAAAAANQRKNESTMTQRSESRAETSRALPPTSHDDEFMERAEGILQFEEDSNSEENGQVLKKKSGETQDGRTDEQKLKDFQSAVSPIPQDASPKRHVSSKLLKYAKPLTWENSLVGLSINGFDIGTSQGPTADAHWYREVTDALESVAQFNKRGGTPQPRRRLALPETIYPTAHVALEGHGFWLSWDVLDALEEWARAHAELEVHSLRANRGVSVMRSSDGTKFWEEKRTATKHSSTHPSSYHFDWTYSTPFPGKVEGGEWVELDESGMRVELLTDTSVPILFFDEIVLFEDDLQNHGQVHFSVKLRVMPSCAYVLARLYIRVDQVTIRVRESRMLVDFFGISPAVFRDVTWRECRWELLAHKKLPTKTHAWHFDGNETPAWQNLLRKIPEVDPPEGVMKYATLQPSKALLVKQLNDSVAEALSLSAGVGDSSLDYLEV